MDQFIQQDPFGSDQDEWDWYLDLMRVEMEVGSKKAIIPD